LRVHKTVGDVILVTFGGCP